MTIGQRFVRLTTDVSVRWPRLWRLFRPLVRRQFGRMAPVWGQMRSEDAFESLERALDRLDGPPRRTLDLGTGTGQAAFVIAERFPETEVVGTDLAPEMLAEARSATPPHLAERLRFDLADASRLPYADGEFDLVSLANLIPFFDELARVTAPGADSRTLQTFPPGEARRCSRRSAERLLQSALGGRSWRGHSGPDVLFTRG